MPRLLRYSFILAVMIAVTTAAFAQPSGGGSGQITPTPVMPTIPGMDTPFTSSEFQELQDILDNPQGALDEVTAWISAEFSRFINENRAELEYTLDALKRGIESNITHLMAIVFGLAALLMPQKTKLWIWLFVGAIFGYIFSQLPQAFEIRMDMAREMSFMLEEPQGTIGLIVAGALAGIIIISPLFYLTLTVAGALAGAIIVFNLSGNNPDAVSITFGIGGFIGFTLIAYVLGRATLLIPLGIGAVMLVFGLGLPPVFILPLAVLGGLFAAVNSPKGRKKTQRTTLPSLKLQDGKVELKRAKNEDRRHLHEILPQMSDDRDEPLIRH